MGNENSKFRILFVCMGNICRSPAAEAVLRKMLADAGLDDQVECASAGTISYHDGEPADPRMRRLAAERGYVLDGRARQVRFADLRHYDMILTMDAENLGALREIDQSGAFTEKIVSLTDFISDPKIIEVPDPYYGDTERFKRSLDIIEDACAGLVASLKEEISATETNTAGDGI